MEAEAPADERDGRREVSFYRRSGLGYYSLRLRNSRGPLLEPLDLRQKAWAADL